MRKNSTVPDCLKPESLALDDWIQAAIQRVADLDADWGREYCFPEVRNPVLMCRDGAFLIVCKPRLQLSNQQAALMVAVLAGRNPELPRRSTASEHASRSRALRRRREQGLLSHCHRLRLTESGEWVAKLLTADGRVIPVKERTPRHFLNRVIEKCTPLIKEKAFPNLNGVATNGTLLRDGNRLHDSAPVAEVPSR